MTTIKSREPAVEAEPTKMAEVEGEIREFLRQGAANLRRSPESDSDRVANNINSLLHRVAGTSVQEIDRLIAELQSLRELVGREGSRVEGEIVQFATLTQSAMQIIAESLRHWKNVPHAPSIQAET